MLLAIDIGNTNSVFALFNGDDLMHSWRCKTESSRSADEYAVFLNQLFDLVSVSWKDINAVIISSVVPDTNFHLMQLCEKYLNTTPKFIDIGNTNISIDLDNPTEIGADRIVNAAAVIKHYNLPAIVIDFGTATTFDVIDKDGIYKGGVIAPGIRLSVDALTKRAAKLPKVNIEKPKNIIGTNTLDAMKSGMYWGYIGLIDTIVEKIKHEIGDNISIIATGGLASLYAQSTKSIDIVDENLIFKGLLEIHKQESNNE